MTTVRHFTATGFVVYGDAVLLHWHRKLKMWMPPGGHIEANEDPVQTVVREAEEETGLQVEVRPTGRRFGFAYPDQIPAPIVILEEDIDDPVAGPHRHIDFIYLLSPTESPPARIEGWRWVTRTQLENLEPLPSPEGIPVPPAGDVAELGLVAIEEAAAWSG